MSYLTGTVETTAVRVNTVAQPVNTSQAKFPPPKGSLVRIPVKGSQPVLNSPGTSPSIPASPMDPVIPGPTPAGWVMTHRVGLGIASAVILIGGYFVFRKKKQPIAS